MFLWNNIFIIQFLKNRVEVTESLNRKKKIIAKIQLMKIAFSLKKFYL